MSDPEAPADKNDGKAARPETFSKEDRLGEALRANLRRRKTAAKARKKD